MTKRKSHGEYDKGTQRLFSVKQTVRRSKYCLPSILYRLNTAKNFLMNAPFRYIFRSLSKKIIFPILFLMLGYFSYERKPNIFGLKNVMEGGIRKILTENVQNLASRIFGKITLNPLQFRKASSSPRMTEQKQIL